MPLINIYLHQCHIVFHLIFKKIVLEKTRKFTVCLTQKKKKKRNENENEIFYCNLKYLNLKKKERKL